MIAVTADIGELSQARAIECGMRGTLTKPIRIKAMQDFLLAIGQEIVLARQRRAIPQEFNLKLGDGEVPALMRARLNRKGAGEGSASDGTA